MLHTALAEHLPLPSTKAVKRVLDGAGIGHRPGVRTPAGNGPGEAHHNGKHHKKHRPGKHNGKHGAPSKQQPHHR
ncbi:hypothetical protein [Streptomyces sp. NBC_00118]|uniref:hypothetical protein n=1 Tax=Streptomyces sp. NBC_00118 TaxID=2975658 RepID=UPI0032509F2E